jgi:hypothetical protein
VAGKAPTETNTMCEVCPPGQYSSFGQSCGYCEAGKEPNIVESGVGATHCTACIDGTYRHNDGTADGVMQSCQSCAPGRQANDEQDECEDCALGQYSDDVGDCIPCSAGTEPNADQSACQACPLGSKSDGTEMCERCGVGETPDVNQQYCVSCTCGQHGSCEAGVGYCVCTDGFTGTNCEALPAGFTETVTISGCTNSGHCGTFHRVLANCTSGNRCPGGQYEYTGSTDPSMCHGAPVYQNDDGSVLYHHERSDRLTGWIVADSSALENCGSILHHYMESALGQRGPPTAPAYSTGTNAWGQTTPRRTGWVDLEASPDCLSNCGITVTVGSSGR